MKARKNWIYFPPFCVCVHFIGEKKKNSTFWSFRNWKSRTLAHSVICISQGGGEENGGVQRATERTEKKGTSKKSFLRRKSKNSCLWFSVDVGIFFNSVFSHLVWSHHGEGSEDKSLSLQENNRCKDNLYYRDDLWILDLVCVQGLGNNSFMEISAPSLYNCCTSKLHLGEVLVQLQAARICKKSAFWKGFSGGRGMAVYI